MPFVIDACVAACWVLPDERHPVAERAWREIAVDFALAPALWWYELRNVMIVNERRGRLDSARTTRALQLLGELPITIDNEVDGDRMMQLARRHRLTVYDAAYLELALRKAHPLATLDAALAKAGRAESAPLLGEGAE